MKEPIKPEDIREGDSIRIEGDFGNGVTATEYRALRDRDQWDAKEKTYFLLDRPAPTVDLPTEPTFGRVTFADGDWFYGTMRVNADGRTFTATRHDTGYHSACWVKKNVTAFTPAIAVPTEALNRLRDTPIRHLEAAQVELDIFFMAVDAANGDHA